MGVSARDTSASGYAAEHENRHIVVVHAVPSRGRDDRTHQAARRLPGDPCDGLREPSYPDVDVFAAPFDETVGERNQTVARCQPDGGHVPAEGPDSERQTAAEDSRLDL